jgi:hypothetical protein
MSGKNPVEFPLLRTAPHVSGALSYKHFTPNRVKPLIGR